MAAVIIAAIARVIVALVRQAAHQRAAGHESNFVIGPCDVSTWTPRVGHLVLHLHEGMPVDGLGPIVRTVAVVPGQYRAFEVVANGGVVLAECRGEAAAFSIALEYLMAPALAATQHEHDMCAV
jgi:hypothetical protein